MTIEESLMVYEPLTYLTCAGDNLTKIVDALYDSRDSKYYFVIVRLNPDIPNGDWWPNDGFAAGTQIKYYPKDICNSIYEVNG